MFGSEIDNPLVILREKLEKIQRTEPYTDIAQAINKKADIVFQLGTDEYRFRKYIEADLPEIELDWLASEISDFLEFPITKKSFT